jgi:hypothetical protein
MFEARSDILSRLQKVLGDLECEFLYLTSDVGLFSPEILAESAEARANLTLASFCVAMAAQAVNHDIVTDLIKKQ